ncbi:MAG: benzoate/H(+) symporter BenE family transporter [Micropepsaceae bacterium]
MPSPAASPLFPLSAVSAGIVAILVGFGSTIVLVVQAHQAMGASSVQIASGATALCLGMAIGGAILSFALRMPIVLAWSSAGAALLASSDIHPGYPAAIGAFIVAAALMLLVGLVPLFGRLAARIPSAIASAMLAGVLLPFCLALFQVMQRDLTLGGILLAVFVIARLRFASFALLIVLAAAFTIVAARGQGGGLVEGPLFGTLHFTPPVFDIQAIIGLGLPLFLVTLVSQNLPGFTILRAAGYQPPPQPILTGTAVSWLAFAPFGAFTINLAAITAAICTGPDANPDASRRYGAALVYAGGYAILALFTAPIVNLFATLPPDTVAAIAGVALLLPLANAMGGIFADPGPREPAIITFAATASGFALFGIGSAFWGLVAGFLALGAQKLLRRPT